MQKFTAKLQITSPQKNVQIDDKIAVNALRRVTNSTLKVTNRKKSQNWLIFNRFEFLKKVCPILGECVESVKKFNMISIGTMSYSNHFKLKNCVRTLEHQAILV